MTGRGHGTGMTWVEVILAIWGFSALIVAWCYLASMREQRDRGDS